MGEKQEKACQAVVVVGGETVCDEGYDKPQAARRKVCRVVVAHGAESGKVVFNNVTLPKSGGLMTEVITRDAAMREVFPKGKMAVHYTPKVGVTANRMRVKACRSVFSGG